MTFDVQGVSSHSTLCLSSILLINTSKMLDIDFVSIVWRSALFSFSVHQIDGYLKQPFVFDPLFINSLRGSYWARGCSFRYSILVGRHVKHPVCIFLQCTSRSSIYMSEDISLLENTSSGREMYSKINI